MCQPKEKGGRRCPAHQPASIGMKKFMNEQYGLLPEQIEHTFKGLRAQAANRPDPTPEEYAYFISRQKTKLNNSSLDDKAKRSVLKQLDKELSESELPDGATFYALKKLQARSREQKAEFVQMIRQIADHRGTNRNEALRAFKEAYEANEETYDNDYAESFDTKSKAVAASLMGREGISSTGMPEFSSEPRVTREAVDSTWITSMGYDPDDGRLEVETNGRVYAYHGVPQELYDRIQENHGTLAREVFRRSTYAYESAEAAQADSVGRYCEDCHKYRAISGHTCDFSAAEAREAEIPEDIREAIANTSEEEERPRRRRARAATPEPEPEPEPEKPKLSYEESLRRIQEQMTPKEGEAAEAAEEAPAEEEAPTRQRRQRTGPSARQRRWMRPLSERETVDLNESSFAPVDGSTSRYYSNDWQAPRAVDIRRAVIQNGNVATFNIQRTNTAYDYDESTPDERGYREPQRVTGQVTQQVKAYIDNEDGEIKFERVGDPKCNCPVYQRNGTCIHMSIGQYNLSNRLGNADRAELIAARMQAATGALNRAVDSLHQTVDRASYLRSTSTEGTPIAVRHTGRRTSRREFNGVSSGNHLSATEWRSARQIMDSGQTVSVQIDDFSARSEGDSYYNRHGGSATVTMAREGDEYVVREAVVRCYRCGRNQETCPHSEGIGNFALAGVRGELETPSRSGYGRAAAVPQVDYANMEPAERLRQLNESQTWAANEEDVAQMSTFATPTGVDHSYSANLDKYIEDVRAAEAKIKAGENPIPFSTEPVTNGVCAPGSGRGFGIELEYDLPSGINKHEAMQAIARDMHAAGLSDIDYGTHYHGYRGNRWHIESDCTVAGEVVSPILQDTPEHWEEVQKVCDIIKRHGGKASVNTGGHVHMGLGQGERAEVERRKVAVTQIYAAYEDTIRRVHTNPERKKHRDSEWCTPMGERTAQNNIYDLRQGYSASGSHNQSLNMGHEGRIEFRGSDGSLDPAHIQAQVMVAAGIVKAAERGELEGETLKVSKVGSNAKKMKLISGGKQTKAKTDDELVVSDIELRRFTDDILGSEHGRKVMAGIAAAVPWQETRYER